MGEELQASKEMTVQEWASELRNLIGTIANDVWQFQHKLKTGGSWAVPSEPVAGKEGEQIANAILSYRHLEEASMRLGKVIQANDGSKSVYSK